MSFKRFDPQDFLISADTVVGAVWTGNSNILTEFYTSSVQQSSTSGTYYLSIFQTGSTFDAAEVQFNIAYGDSVGSGSAPYDSNIAGLSPSATVFGQWQNTVLGDENTDFEFGSVTPVTQSIYALSFERARYKGSFFPGSLNLKLTGGGASLYLTDNSKDVTSVSYNEAGRVFQLVSGSSGVAVNANIPGQVANGMTISGSYGLFLPDIGTIILNASALKLSTGNGGLSSEPTRGQTNANNPQKVYELIKNGASFQLSTQEVITSDYVFVRARNGEFNYSTNPSFSSGSVGDLTHDEFINSPQTFLTSIGMYNDNNELLAVAKLSKPLKKDFTKEALVRVKLDF